MAGGRRSTCGVALLASALEIADFRVRAPTASDEARLYHLLGDDRQPGGCNYDLPALRTALTVGLRLFLEHGHGR